MKIDIPEMTFEIIDESFPLLKNAHPAYEKHCVTYLLHNNKDIYIGETSNLKVRMKDHEKQKKTLNFLSTKIIISPFFNKSAIYDIESRLINYIHADGKYKVINIKKEQSSHFYHLKDQINKSLFEKIWNGLRAKNLINNRLIDIENSYLFKYSPFKELSENQFNVVDQIIQLVTNKTEKQDLARDGSITTIREFNPAGKKIIVEGGPGTGKTLLIIKLIDDLVALHRVNKESEIAVCVPQKSLLKTFKMLFRESGIKVKVIKPIEISKVPDKHYDLLIVDEAHRLKRYFSKQSNVLQHLEGGKYNELDIALKKSKNIVLMHDPNQTVRPADIPSDEIQSTPNLEFLYLTQQFRVKEGLNYLEFVLSLLQINQAIPNPVDLGDYKFEVIDDIKEMSKKIKALNNEHGLSRMASGYYKEWISKSDSNLFDFEEEGLRMKWNTTDTAWVRTKESINEIGCIHTLQGEDLNYCGVILGDEIYLDSKDNRIKIKKENYKDKNGTPVHGTDEDGISLENKIKNIYYVLLTRGIHGTYLYIKDKNLRNYIKACLKR